ncbi:MAG: hypothetical protein B7Y75_01925 [Azorhizobium sp. 35-67-5]|nr:MAG: hypothetical protein B7Y75_01925 [Azorhizobium sp. 35-67-5]
MTNAVLAPALPGFASRTPGALIGTAALVRWFEEGHDLAPVWDHLVARLDTDPADAAALMDMSTLLLIRKARRKGEAAQAAALDLQRHYRRSYNGGGGVRLLAFVTAGDLMANTPLDFLLTGSDFDLHLFYVDKDTASLDAVPDHDVAIVAVGESPENQAVLLRLSDLLQDWPTPVVNGPPLRIAAMTRDRVCALFADTPSVLAPATRRIDRQTLLDIARGDLRLERAMPGISFPIIVRPIASHAGEGLEKIDDTATLLVYLLERGEPDFFLSPFIDYRSADGMFRKQRIAFIDGKAYPSHGATSAHWMVHYVNASMRHYPERRAEEAAFMEGFDRDFAVRHAAAFTVLAERIGLDYFAIDSAELPDGRLLLFEADVAMVIHDADCARTFPYKKPAMHRLFAAFQRAIAARCGVEQRQPKLESSAA